MDMRGISRDSCSKRLRKADCRVGVTTITDLPDEILVRILSLLSTEEAVKTVVILGLGDVWRAVPVLDFNSKGNPHVLNWEHVNGAVSRGIGHVLNLHDSGTLDKLCIKLVFPKFDLYSTMDRRTLQIAVPYPQCTISCVKNAVAYALRRKVKILDLNFNASCSDINHMNKKLYDISDHHILVSDHLTDLRLTACGITSCSCINVNLKSLKVLFLNVVSLTDVMMEQVLAGCPLLEDLSLVDCFSLSKLTCRNPKLRNLMLTHSKFSCCITHVACPYVLRLEIMGYVGGVVLLDASSVVDVAIHVDSCFPVGTIELNQPFWGLMQQTSHCKNFSAGGWAGEELAVCGYRFRDWPSFCFKSLVLEMGLTRESEPGIALLLRNCQSLETLTLHFHAKQLRKRQSDPKEVWDFFYGGAKYWKTTTFTRLVTINIHGSINGRYVLQLVQVLLRRAIRLERLVISTKDIDCPFGRQGDQYTFKQLQQLEHVYKALARASPEAVVYFS